MGMKTLTSVTRTTERLASTFESISRALEYIGWIQRLASEYERLLTDITVEVTYKVAIVRTQSEQRPFIRKYRPVIPQELPTVLSRLLFPSLTELLMYRRKGVPSYRVEQIQRLRRHFTREELIEAEFLETELEPPFYVVLDVTDLANLETDLKKRYGLQLEQIVEEVVDMCRNRQSSLTLVETEKAVRKLLLEILVPYFHARPYTMNMLSVRYSPLTKSYLEGLVASMYMYGVIEALALQTKALVETSTKRRLRTKYIATGKPNTKPVPVRFGVGYTKQFTGEEKVGIPKDLQGKEVLFTAIRYAYGMPYWIRRWIAHHFGMPENHKYARYFGIGVIPSRRKTLAKELSKYPEVQYLYYHRDEYVRKLIREYQSRYGHYYRERGFSRKRRRL